MANGTAIGERFNWLDRLLARAIENRHLLSDFQSGFVDSQVERVAKYRRNTYFSPKQMDVLESLENDLNEAGVVDDKGPNPLDGHAMNGGEP